MTLEEIKRALGLEIYQALHTRPDKDPRRDPQTGETLWIAAAGPMVDYLYLASGSSVQGLHWVTTIDNTTTNDIIAANLKSNSNIYINQDGADGDSFVYFYNNGTPTHKYIQWDDGSDRFFMNDAVEVSGSAYFYGHAYVNFNGPDASSYFYFYEGGSVEGAFLGWNDIDGRLVASHTFFSLVDLKAGSDIYINSNGGDGNSYLYFYEGGSSTGASLYWNDAQGRFQITDGLRVEGHIYGDDNININTGGPDGDSYLFFYENSSNTGAYLKWDDSDDRFYMNDSLEVSHDLIAGNDLYLNFDASDSHAILYFYKPSSGFETFQYNKDVGYFIMSDAVNINGSLYANSNIYINFDGGEVDSTLFFYQGGSNEGAYLRFDTSPESFKMNYGLKAGDGGSTNYCEIKADGEIELHGTARVHKEIRVPITEVTVGASAPGSENIAIGASGNILVPVLSFNPSSAQDEEGYIYIHMPTNADDSVNVEFHMMGKPKSTWASGSYIWKLDYLVKTAGDNFTTGTPTTITETVTPSNATDIIETTFSSTIDANVEDIVFARFYLDNASTATVDGHVIYLELHYTVNKLGEVI